VDSHESHFALEQSHAVGSKTRREADPWWEVDLGRTHHVHSVSLSMKGSGHERVEVYILLLKGPVGFENPFLDR
jgi:hypothetical protein